MKSIILILILTGMTLCCSALIQINMGLDVGGKQHYKPSIGTITQENWDVENGWSPSLELMLQKNNFKMGWGIEYQFPRSVKDSPVEFNFIPIYAVARYETDLNIIVVPETVIQCGYNFFQAEHFNEAIFPDKTGGLYYGFGECFTYRDFILQFLYKVNSGKLSGIWSGQTNEMEITNREFNISLGYRF